MLDKIINKLIAPCVTEEIIYEKKEEKMYVLISWEFDKYYAAWVHLGATQKNFSFPVRFIETSEAWVQCRQLVVPQDIASWRSFLLENLLIIDMVSKQIFRKFMWLCNYIGLAHTPQGFYPAWKDFLK